MKKSLFLLLLSFASLHNVTTPAVAPVVANAAIPAGQMFQNEAGRQLYIALKNQAPELLEKYAHKFFNQCPKANKQGLLSYTGPFKKVSGNPTDGYVVGGWALPEGLEKQVIEAVNAEKVVQDVINHIRIQEELYEASQTAFDLARANDDGMGLVKAVTPQVYGSQEVVNYWTDQTPVPSLVAENQPCAYADALEMISSEVQSNQAVENALVVQSQAPQSLNNHEIVLSNNNVDLELNLTLMDKFKNIFNAHKNVIIGTTAAITVAAVSYMAYQYWKSLQIAQDVQTAGEAIDKVTDGAKQGEYVGSSKDNDVLSTDGKENLVPAGGSDHANVINPENVNIPTLKDKIFNNLRALSNAQKAAIGSALAAVGLGASYKVATKKPALDHLVQQYLYDTNEENMQIKIDNFMQAAVKYGYTSEEDEIYIANILAELELI